jgi:hypothetical protein
MGLGVGGLHRRLLGETGMGERCFDFGLWDQL